MTTLIEIYYDAKCKDCMYCGELFKGKRKLHTCTNIPESSYNTIRLRDKACKQFKLKY